MDERIEELTQQIIDLLEQAVAQLRAIHQHVGPTCPDFREEERTNGQREVKRLDG